MNFIDVQFNDILASSLGIYMKNKPAIPSSQEDIQTLTVPGMDGELIIRKGIYKSTSISVDFNPDLLRAISIAVFCSLLSAFSKLSSPK